jgi:hypothetical protein
MSERIQFDITERTGFSDETDNMRRAELVARMLLKDWRKSLGSDDLAENAPLQRHYTKENGEQVTVDSQSDTSVRVVQAPVHADARTYDFTYENGKAILDVAGIPADEDPSALGLYAQFCELLFMSGSSELHREPDDPPEAS